MDRAPSFAYWPAALVFALAACGEGDGTQGTDGPAEIAVAEVAATVQDPDLTLVMDAAVDDQGRVWVLSVYPPHVRVFSPDGAPVSAFADTGGGPDEFGHPRSLLPPPPGEEGMRVLDAQRAALRHLAVDGTVLGERSVEAQLPLPHEIRFAFFGDLSRAWAVPGGVLQDVSYSPMGGAAPFDFWGMELLLTPDEGDPRSLGALHEFAGLPPPPPWGPNQPPRVLGAGPLLDVCPDGTIVLHAGADARLVRISAEGDMLGDARVELPLQRNSVATMVTWLTNIAETLDPGPMDSREALRERSRMVAEMAEPVMEPQVPPTLLRCDAEGRIWIQLFDLDDDPRGYARRWAVLDRDGAVISLVSFPHGFLPLRFGEGWITGVVRDGLGLETVGWVPIPDLP